MTEVPEHLLQRSRDRRKALGSETGEEEAAPVAQPAAGEALPAVATTAATPDPGIAELPELAPDPEPQPEPIQPWVQAALVRKKIPVWAMPVLLFLPFWAIIFAGTLESGGGESEIMATGREIYAEAPGNCAGCHGAEGGGGVGPALVGGEVVATFPAWEDHVIWIINGSPPVGTPYGAQQEISSAGMPAFGESLSAHDLLAVTYFERVEFGGVEPAALADLEKLFKAENLPDNFEENATFGSTLRNLLEDAGEGG